MPLTLNDFDYTLPPDLIAQAPLAQRSASRLLVVHPPMEGAEVLVDRNFADLPALIGPQDLLVFNDTRVIHARVHGSKASGGQIEVLIERAIGPHEALAQVRASKSPRSGSTLRLADAFDVEVLGRVGEFYHLRFPAHHLTFRHRAGVTPYTSTFVFAQCCVFNKQLQPAGIFDWSQLHPQGLHLHTSVPSPEVTAPFCLVPSPEFSQAPWYSLPDHLCRFGVRFNVT